MKFSLQLLFEKEKIFYCLLELLNNSYIGTE